MHRLHTITTVIGWTLWIKFPLANFKKIVTHMVLNGKVTQLHRMLVTLVHSCLWY
ncbi:hypothetical protein HanPSC8_Chr17g0786781 [Helianthus annuus]|nr:hypothetical protein HanPSC8_Chr17g0786781 [Helianthus annuus]